MTGSDVLGQPGVSCVNCTVGCEPSREGNYVPTGRSRAEAVACESYGVIKMDLDAVIRIARLRFHRATSPAQRE
jgi:hypothetical protein